MKKGKIAVGVIAAVLVVAAAACAVWFAVGKPLVKTISAKGYEISVPKGWSSDANGTLTDKNGVAVGKFVLVNEEPDANNAVAYSGFEAKGNVKTENKTEVILKNTFETDSGRAVQYFIKNIPNPEPYAISITLLRTGVSSMTAERIAASLKIPEIGSKPPQKNIAAVGYYDIGDDKTAKITLSDGSTAVKNVSLIDAFISRQKKGERTGLDILSYETTADGAVLKTWSHIESDAGRGYLYSYYDRGDGVYTYDNNPVIFDGLTKEIVKDKGITSYRLKTGETETSRLLEIPTNLYRDNAEALVAMKTAESTDQSVMQILEKILTPDQMKTVSATKSAEGLKLVFSEEANIDRTKLTKDAAVLFSLLSDVNTITVEKTGGDTFVLKRNDVMKQAGAAAETATNTPEDFAKFAEELDTIPPAKPQGGTDGKSSDSPADSAADGDVVYSSTVVISSSTKVKHPRTGEMVAIGPYAEQMGVSQYLNKPISCVIKKAGSIYLATATCGGSVIYSQPLESEAAVQDAIRQIQSYS